MMRAAILTNMTEADCIARLKETRWPNGFRCPRCGAKRYYEVTVRRLPLYECADCGYQCSLISGTVMERSRVPLRKWLAAIRLIATEPVSAVALSRLIEVTYKTAWLMLHKLRSAMARCNERDPLTGIIRFNVAVSGQQSIPSREGLHDVEHPFIIGGAMLGDYYSRITKIMLVQDTGGDTCYWKIMPRGARNFIERYTAPASSTYDLNVLGPGPVMPCALRRIGTVIARTISRVHNGIGAKHLQYYLHEHAYRFNRCQELLSSRTAAQLSYTPPMYRNLPNFPGGKFRLPEHIRQLLHAQHPDNQYRMYAAQTVSGGEFDAYRAFDILSCFNHMLVLACSVHAPAMKNITQRATPGRPDWNARHNWQRIRLEMNACAREYGGITTSAS